MDLNELLRECFEALCMSSCDGHDRDEHLAYIKEALARDNTPEDARELLRSAATIFREHQKRPLVSLVVYSGAEELVALIRSKMGRSLPQFIYHGTIYGRLAQIAKDGLLPGKVPVWKEPRVPRQFADAAVFFDTTWRRTLDWAEAAHTHSRGRKDGIHRTPVIIRLLPSELPLEPDRLAASPGCLMVKGKVPVNGAYVLVGRVRGFPKWQSMADALASRHL